MAPKNPQAAPKTAPAAAPVPAPEQKKDFVVSEPTQASLRAFINAKNEALLSLGTLEAEYVTRKAQIMTDANNATNTLNGLIKSAAREAGVPIEQGNWNLDFATMKFTRVG